MDRYSAIDIGVGIRKNKLGEFRRKLEEVRSKSKQEEWEMEIADMTVDGYGHIGFDEYYSKWYKDREWCGWIAPYATKGRIEFAGEDDTRWGYEFDGRGNVFELVYKTKRGKKLKLDEV